MKLSLYEAPGLIEFSEKLDDIQKSLNTKALSPYQLKEILRPYNVTFAIEKGNRLQSLLLCQLEDSYVQQSGRYVVAQKDGYTTPVMEDEDVSKYHDLMEQVFTLYEKMTIKKDPNSKGRPKPSDYVYGIPIEDARYIFPLSVHTNMVVAMNGSKLIDMFMMLCQPTYEEIFDTMIRELERILPVKLFKALYMSAMTHCTEIRCQGKHSGYDDINLQDLDKISTENNVVFLRGFKNPRLRIGLGAVTSTQNKTPSETLEAWGINADEKAKGVANRVLGYGHSGVSEQSRETFGIMVSLVSFHQQIRHRLPEDYNECLEDLIKDIDRPVKVPPTIAISKFNNKYIELTNEIKKFRLYLLNKYGFGIASHMLLFCDQIKQVTSTNARMDCDIMVERLCQTAQWEIREMYEKKYAIMSLLLPEVYNRAIPPCVFGKCKEGALTCGKAEEMKRKYAQKNG